MNRNSISTLFCLFLLCSFLYSVESAAQSKECVKGDCVNGLGHTQFENGDFYIGHRKIDKRNGIGMAYYAHSAQNNERAVFSFYPKKLPNDTVYLASPILILDLTTNQKWMGFASVTDPIKRGLYVDPELNIFAIYPGGNLPADLSVECLEGDCKEGIGALKFTDSNSIDHYYYGKFKGGKFNGQGIEMIAQTGQVLIGNFVQDNCVEGILYKLEDNIATYYKNSQVVSEFYWEYAPPWIDPAIAANKAALAKAQQDALAAKKEKRKNIWSAIGLTAAAVTVVTAAVILSDDEGTSSTNKSTPSKSSGSNTTGKGTTSASSGSGAKCYYCFLYVNDNKNEILKISPIYSFRSSTVPSATLSSTVTKTNNQAEIEGLVEVNGVFTPRKVANPNYGATYQESIFIGNRVCKTDFKILQSARNSKIEEADNKVFDIKEMPVERVKECN
jgi:hypothetical protein